MLEHNRQIEMMQRRENEDLFLSKLAEMREEAARLNNIQLDLNQLNLVRIDQPAVKPLKPVKPKKLMIVALGLVLGGMLRMFLALIRAVFISRSQLSCNG